MTVMSLFHLRATKTVIDELCEGKYLILNNLLPHIDFETHACFVEHANPRKQAQKGKGPDRLAAIRTFWEPGVTLG